LEGPGLPVVHTPRSCTRTTGGHRRYRLGDVLALRSGRLTGETSDLAARAAVWSVAVLALLEAAAAGVGHE